MSQTSPAPRLVLLYATCTLKRDLIAPYGSVPYTPHLAAFAGESVVFRRHHTETDQSGPAYASLFSGSEVDRHGIFRHPARLPDHLHLAAEAFAAHGYEAHFWSGHAMASAELNYGQGVEPRNVHRRRAGVDPIYALTGSDEEFSAILTRLRRDPTFRAYVQVAFSVTHGPYTRFDPLALRNFRHDHPEEWPSLSDDEVARFVRLYEDNHLRLQWDFPKAVRELGLGPTEVSALAAVLEAHYKARVRLLDHCLGRVLQKIREAGLLEESLIAFTADHGETLYREDTLFKWTHGLELHPDTIEVPLIVRLPGAQPLRGSYDGISRSIDVYPTLAGLSGFSVGTREGVDGLDLSAAVRGRMRPPSLRAFSHTTLLGPELVEQFRGWGVSRYHPSTGKEHLWASVRDDDLYARLRRREDGDWGVDLFRLGDPRGPAPMFFDDRQRAHRDLDHELEGYKARLLRAYEDQGRERARLEPDARERLRSLGYIQ